MRTITIEQTLYNIDDVLNNPTLKEKVLSKHYDINVDFEGWHDYILEECKQELEKQGFLSPEIYYTGFNSQGDGACFKCFDFDFELLLKDYKCKHKKLLINILKKYVKASINERSNFNRYHHENTLVFNLYIACQSCFTHLEKQLAKIESYIEEKRYLLSINIYNRLQNEYDLLTSESEIIETLKANEYEFLEDGSIF